jgi:hypothetical protein
VEKAPGRPANFVRNLLKIQRFQAAGHVSHGDHEIGNDSGKPAFP